MTAQYLFSQGSAKTSLNVRSLWIPYREWSIVKLELQNPSTVMASWRASICESDLPLLLHPELHTQSTQRRMTWSVCEGWPHSDYYYYCSPCINKEAEKLKLTFPYSTDRKWFSNPDARATILCHLLCCPFCSFSATKVFSHLCSSKQEAFPQEWTTNAHW